MAPLLEVRGLVKTFGHVQALRGADFDIHAGEVVGLVGDNGAGKSTLVKILSGGLQPDDGAIRLDGRAVRFASPMAAREHGIETVYQDLALAPDLDPVANLFLGRERRGAGIFGVLRGGEMRAEAGRLFAELGVRIPSLETPVGQLSGGQRQGIAVARAVAWAKRLILMDEPTAALGVSQRERVEGLITAAKERGIAVVLISHNIPEIRKLADRIQVFRQGRRTHVFDREPVIAELVTAMTGFSEAGAA